MKPLELTVYPKSRGMFGAQYDLADGRHMLAREGADVLSRNKRLTDAELAAEYWEHRYGNEVASGWASDYSIIKQSRERLETIGRFARLPHYDEADL